MRRAASYVQILILALVPARRKSLPMEVAVAFNGKYGRHCIPLEYSSESNQTEPKLYEACSKRKCPTCKFRIPPVADDNDQTTIQTYISVPNKHGEETNLVRYYNKCVPNLPPNLVCPSCRCSDKRALVLSVLSYPSSTTTAQHTLLTYTPQREDEAVSISGCNGCDADTDDDEQEPARKKQRMIENKPEDSFAFPHIHNDLSIPTTWEPLEQDNDDVKHAIAIHCVECKNFGVVTPAGPCCHARFPCHERTRQVTIGKHAATIGGVYVRRKCSNQDCLYAISCEACSRQVEHPAYGREEHGSNVIRGTVAHKTRCQHCNVRYCNECAWLTTVCHHW